MNKKFFYFFGNLVSQGASRLYISRKQSMLTKSPLKRRTEMKEERIDMMEVLEDKAMYCTQCGSKITNCALPCCSDNNVPRISGKDWKRRITVYRGIKALLELEIERVEEESYSSAVELKEYQYNHFFGKYSEESRLYDEFVYADLLGDLENLLKETRIRETLLYI